MWDTWRGSWHGKKERFKGGREREKEWGKFDCGVVDWRKGCGIGRGQRERERIPPSECSLFSALVLAVWHTELNVNILLCCAFPPRRCNTNDKSKSWRRSLHSHVSRTPDSYWLVLYTRRFVRPYLFFFWGDIQYSILFFFNFLHRWLNRGKKNSHFCSQKIIPTFGKMFWMKRRKILTDKATKLLSNK